MFSINELIGKPYIDEDDIREELAAIYGGNFVLWECSTEDCNDNSEDDFLMCERYCNDDSTLDITVWYGNNSRKIENTEEKKCSLARFLQGIK